MARPTDTLWSETQPQNPRAIRLAKGYFDLGRVAMAMEILTVVKTLEGAVGSSLLALEREEIISVLLTLVRNQDLEEVANAWYDYLSKARRLSFVAVASEDELRDARVSAFEAQLRALPPPLDSDESPPPDRTPLGPSDVLGESATSEASPPEESGDTPCSRTGDESD